MEICQRLDVDYIGINVIPSSKRFVELNNLEALYKRAQELEIEKKLVFVTNSLDSKLYRALVSLVGSAFCVQMHRVVLDSEMKALRVEFPSLTWWGAIPSELLDQPQKLHAAFSTFQLVIIDAVAGDQFGGTGSSFEWKNLSKIAQNCSYGVAGGISVHNLQSLLEVAQPSLVDIASGSEDSPGIKSEAVISKLMTIMRATTLYEEI